MILAGYLTSLSFSDHICQMRIALVSVSRIIMRSKMIENFPGGSDSKASAYNAGDPGLIPGSRRYSEEGNGNPLQYSCLENPMDREAW